MTPKKQALVKEVEKVWLSTREAAKYLGVGTTYIADLRKEGQLRHCMVKNTAFFRKDDIDAFLEEHRIY